MGGFFNTLSRTFTAITFLDALPHLFPDGRARSADCLVEGTVGSAVSLRRTPGVARGMIVSDENGGAVERGGFTEQLLFLLKGGL